MIKMIKGLTLIFVLGCTVIVVASDKEAGIKSTISTAMSTAKKHIQVVKACGTLMHIPYILTLDSKNSQAVRLAGLLAMLPTDCKLGFKFFEQCDDRFFKIMLWDVPKFVAYSGAATYDVLNVLNPEHMVAQRQGKGEDLRKLKLDQAAALTIEFILRILACVASFKAADHVSSRGGADLNMLAALISEIADCAEIARLMSRYNSYSKIPGCDIEFNFEINHDGNVNSTHDDESSVVSASE